MADEKPERRKGANQLLAAMKEMQTSFVKHLDDHSESSKQQFEELRTTNERHGQVLGELREEQIQFRVWTGSVDKRLDKIDDTQIGFSRDLGEVSSGVEQSRRRDADHYERLQKIENFIGIDETPSETAEEYNWKQILAQSRFIQIASAVAIIMIIIGIFAMLGVDVAKGTNSIIDHIMKPGES